MSRAILDELATVAFPVPPVGLPRLDIPTIACRQRYGFMHIDNATLRIHEELASTDLIQQVSQLIVKHLEQRNFLVDPELMKAVRARVGMTINAVALSRDSLRVVLSVSGNNVSVDFCHSSSRENCESVLLSENRLTNMPYLQRLAFLLEMEALVSRLSQTCDYPLMVDNALVCAGDSLRRVVRKASDGLSFAQHGLARLNLEIGAHRFERDPTGWPVPTDYAYGNNRDMDGTRLENGMTRYFRARNGRLLRAKVYNMLNSEWLCVYGPGRSDATIRKAEELFDCAPSKTPRKEYQSDDIRQAHHKAREAIRRDNGMLPMKRRRPAPAPEMQMG